MPSIVTVNVSLQVAPTPSTLQATGALISQGSTTLAPQSRSLITEPADLTAILVGVKTLTTLTWASGVVTAATAAPHGLTTSDTLMLTISGATPTAYNGTYLCTITGPSAFTYPLVANPGTNTAPGSYTPENVTELSAMVTTFFAQGAAQSVYVLELGIGGPDDGVAALTTWLQNNPSTVYSFLVPRTWDAVSSFLALIATYESPTAKTYFHVTTTATTYTSYTSLMKDVIATIEAPGIPANEFSAAAGFYVSLLYRPSNTSKVTPFAFSFLFGVTPYPTVGNGPLLTTLKAAAINVVGTGAEGGISDAILLWGMTKDSRDFTYWYSIDYGQIQAAIALANEVINGSNNPINPLYYDQHGINRLEARLAGVFSNMVTFGLATGSVAQYELDGPALSAAIDSGAFTNQAAINAVPFVPYSLANPGDFKIGTYAGLSVIYIPARGFIHIIINIVATDFISL